MEPAAARRIGRFIWGAAIAFVCSVAVLFIFELLTAMMDPTLSGAAYREAVRDRMKTNPELTGLILVCNFGVVIGIVMMGVAVAESTVRGRSTGRGNKSLKKPS